MADLYAILRVGEAMPRPSLCRVRSDIWNLVEKDEKTGCWLWTGAINSKTGYGSISPKLFGEYYAHRAAYSIASGAPVDPTVIIRHKCDIRRCINPEHLEAGTQADNVRDTIARNRNMFGERHVNAKLNVAKVRCIKERLEAGERQNTIAREYNISASLISRIHTNDRGAWKQALAQGA